MGARAITLHFENAVSQEERNKKREKWFHHLLFVKIDVNIEQKRTAPKIEVKKCHLHY